MRALALAAALAGAAAGSLHAGGQAGDPAPSSLKARIHDVVEDAIRARQMPGAVVLAGHRDRVLVREAIGARAVEPAREAMTLDTVFDAASLTKVVATTTSVMILVQEGRLRLADPVSLHVPGFERYGKREITVRHLLTHTSGLRPDVDLADAWAGYDRGIALAVEEVPVARPDERVIYSDINFLLLGRIVETISGVGLDRFAQDRIFAPLKMTDTGFRPAASLLPRIAPTERCVPLEPCTPGAAAGAARQSDASMLRGVVHDPTARRVGGVAGHAGLFTTADDLARFCRMLLGQGTLDGVRILAPLTVARMTAPSTPAGEPNVRGLGWDLDSSYSSNRGDLLPLGSFGHTGFTGTSIWIDPATSTYVVVLSNRVHPEGKGDVVPLRSRMATLVAAAIDAAPAAASAARVPKPAAGRPAAPAPPAAAKPVLTGIDVLRAEGFARLAGKKVALVTNHTGIARDGTPTIDLLAGAEGVTLVALFSPEHGIRGTLDEKVADRARREDRPADLLALRRDAPADRGDARRRRHARRTTSRTSARASTPTSDDRPRARGGRAPQDRRSSCSTGRTRSTAGASRGRSPTRARSASPATCGSRSATALTIGELAQLFNDERKIGAALTRRGAAALAARRPGSTPPACRGSTRRRTCGA